MPVGVDSRLVEGRTVLASSGLRRRFGVSRSWPRVAHLLSIVRAFVTGDGQHDIKPVVGKASGGTSLGSIDARVAGPLRPGTAMPTNVLLGPQAVRDAPVGAGSIWRPPAAQASSP